jgi:hypothetical protein
VTIKGLQSADPPELDRAAVFGCIGQHLSGRQDCRRAAFIWRDGLDEVRYRLAQLASLVPSASTIGSAKRRDHDTANRPFHTSRIGSGSWMS